MSVKGRQTTLIAVIMAIFFMQISNSAVSAALQSIIEAFPDAPISSVYLILTLPTLFTVVFSFVSGMLTERRAGYRTVALAGLVLLTIAGVIPFFLNSIEAILVSRALFGIGVGLVNPMGNTLAFLYFGPQEGTRVVGLGNTSMNLGALVLQLLGGLLCGIGWRFTFLAYLLGIIPVVITMLFMQEPLRGDGLEAVSGKASQERMPRKVYAIGLAMFLSQMFIYPLYLNLSTIVVSYVGGTPALAGIALGIVNVAGMVVGAVFGMLIRRLGKFTFLIGCICGAIGLFLLSAAMTLPAVFAGCILCGIFNTMMTCAMMAEVGMSVPPEMVSRASGIAMGLFCLAPIVATVYTTLVSQIPGVDPMLFIFVVGAIGVFAIGVVWTVAQFVKPAKKAI